MEGSTLITETKSNARGMLHWEDADGEQQEYYLFEGKTAQLGRQNDENDLVLDSSHVSRQHAIIAWRDGGFEVEDLGSVNGTLVNGERVEQTRILRDGDVIQLYDVSLTFAALGQPEVAPDVAETLSGAPLPTQSQPEASAAPAQRPGRGFWFGWLAATVVGWAVGFAVSSFFGLLLLLAIGRAVGLVFGLPVAIAGGGMAVGVAQWLLLRRRVVPQGRWWLLASIVGWALNLFIFMPLIGGPFLAGLGAPEALDAGAMAATGILVGGVAGTVVGVLQWLVMRRHFSGAFLWVLASSIAWALCLLLFLPLIVGVFFAAVQTVQFTIVALVLVFVAVVGAGAVGGCITGLALLRLLRRPLSSADKSVEHGDRVVSRAIPIE